MALNFIGSLAPFLTLANIARYIVDHWVFVTSIAWIKLFRLASIEIPPVLGFALTLFLFHAGLIASTLRRKGPGVARVPSGSRERDRLIALLLYAPIMAGTLSTAFASLARDTIEGTAEAGAIAIFLSFCIVLASPVLVFWMAAPRHLVRRFLSVYMVAAAILLLDFAARMLESSGLDRRLSSAG